VDVDGAAAPARQGFNSTFEDWLMATPAAESHRKSAVSPFNPV